MKKLFLIILLLTLSVKGYMQISQDKLNTIGVSVPVIWNKSEGTYYALGNRKTPQGNAVSYGLNINWSRTIYKNIFGVAGIGHFRQAFGIERPFNYVTPDSSKPIVTSKKYFYSTIQFNVGIGYQKSLTDALLLKGTLVYNYYHSFRQQYTPQGSTPSQRSKKSIGIGSIINVAAGIEKRLANKISAGIDLIIPISNNWNTDKIFFNNGYANDEQQIARAQSSFGAAIVCNYHF